MNTNELTEKLLALVKEKNAVWEFNNNELKLKGTSFKISSHPKSINKSKIISL